MSSMPRNVPPVPPSGFGRVRLLVVEGRSSLTASSQSFLIGGTIVAAGLGGFYMNMLRRKRIEEERGTNPHGNFRFPCRYPSCLT